MQIVGSGLGYHLHGARWSDAVRCGRGAGLHLELLQGIGKRHGQIAIAERVIVIASIEGEIQTRSQPARDRGSTSSDACRRARKADQLGHITAVQGKFQYPNVLHHAADTHTPCFHENRIRLDFDLLRHLPNF